ncbi:DUF3888 domain-containing protein [Bacillus sp. ISL-4]|uniref:DUF3888 domain-containing protein n=1 Tax=Bacillus sp. ISL-4 TaxID=2819125 RepID=UPI001BE991B5|nr:DUF3888 domain-containing protein [Bacillus sp. ISL-4]MBT2667406.1 DUF3888 domain-containing protein [Bacillus sp. ISL-4]MBT2673037.1 DUF3888 domain-containing protein [Streptomyces sp. ISL-14]
MNKFFLGLSISLLLLSAQPNMITSAETELNNKLIYDTLLTSLDPYISEEVVNYYGYYKQYGLFDAKIIRIIRQSEGSFSFRVTVQVNTFEHAHNPPYGKETITFDVSPFGVKVINFVHKGDEEEMKINEFYKKVLLDILQTFNLRLESFSKYSNQQLLYKSEKQKEYKFLSDIVTDIIVNDLNPDIKPPFKNVIDPVTFIKGTQGYILFKRSDGTNIVLQVAMKNGKWVVVEKKNKLGKKMQNELIWYM